MASPTGWVQRRPALIHVLAPALPGAGSDYLNRVRFWVCNHTGFLEDDGRPQTLLQRDITLLPRARLLLRCIQSSATSNTYT